jgi:hypothetical protein
MPLPEYWTELFGRDSFVTDKYGPGALYPLICAPFTALTRQYRSPACTGAVMVFPAGASGHCHVLLYRQEGW